MVKITPEEVMAGRNRAAESLTDYDRKHLGAAMRLEIPFSDETKMREIATMLRELADFIERMSRNQTIPLASRLSLMKGEAQKINMRIRDLHGNHNKNGTTRATV